MKEGKPDQRIALLDRLANAVPPEFHRADGGGSHFYTLLGFTEPLASMSARAPINAASSISSSAETTTRSMRMNTSADITTSLSRSTWPQILRTRRHLRSSTI